MKNRSSSNLAVPVYAPIAFVFHAVHHGPNRSMVTKLHRYNNGLFQACAARLTVLRLGSSPARGRNVYSSQCNKIAASPVGAKCGAVLHISPLQGWTGLNERGFTINISP